MSLNTVSWGTCRADSESKVRIMKISTQFSYKAGSNEELFPSFAQDFPYIATCAELDKYFDAYVPWHWHRPVELFYMEKGCLEYTTPSGKWMFPAGSGGFVNSNVLHSTKIMQTDEPNIQLLHIFDPSLISGDRGNRLEHKYVTPMISSPSIEMIALYPDNPAHTQLLGNIRRAFDLSDQEWGYEFALREALTDIWMALLDSVRFIVEADKRGSGYDDQIKEMMLYIQSRYDQHISVDELAEVAHVSKRACFRLFQSNLHMTPVEYMKSYRLQIACQLLVDGNAPITEIAGRCGLGSSSYFGKVFKETFGVTPLEYRNHWHDCML